jgi:hypothetical protein
MGWFLEYFVRRIGPVVSMTLKELLPEELEKHITE